MSARPRIAIPREQVAEFCRRNHIRRLALFGSVLRKDFSPASDVDVLVEFDPEHVPGLLGLAGLELELSPILHGRKVDLNTPGFFGPSLRARIESEAVNQYGPA
jgi:predicted nucleotidyltransferase